MSEKVRGALFSALGELDGLKVLDSFAGSGAVSFEAISRGAKHATAIDIDRGAITTVVNSAKTLGISSQIKAIRANASGWSDNNQSVKFDIIICDPPFEELKISLIQKLTKHLSKNGIFIVCMDGNLKPFELQNLKSVKNKNYGDAQLVFYKKIG